MIFLRSVRITAAANNLYSLFFLIFDSHCVFHSYLKLPFKTIFALYVKFWIFVGLRDCGEVYKNKQNGLFVNFLSINHTNMRLNA